MSVDAFMSASTSTPTLCFFGVQRCCLHGRLHVRGRRLADFVFLRVNAFMFMDDFYARARRRADSLCSERLHVRGRLHVRKHLHADFVLLRDAEVLSS